MKTILLFCFLFSPFLTFFNGPDKDTIVWNKDILLKFSDFKGRPVKNGFVGMTEWEIKGSYSFNNGVIKYNVFSSFNKNKSWIISPKQNILIHEQGHFDIAEIYARNFRKILSESSFTIDNVNQKFDSLYKSVFDGCHKYQDLYDSETNHSIDSVKQVAWNERIKSELNALQQYEK